MTHSAAWSQNSEKNCFNSKYYYVWTKYDALTSNFIAGDFWTLQILYSIIWKCDKMRYSDEILLRFNAFKLIGHRVILAIILSSGRHINSWLSELSSSFFPFTFYNTGILLLDHFSNCRNTNSGFASSSRR